MKISKEAQYGLRAMVLLAKSKNKEALSVREISNIEKVPFEFLSKIFAKLEKAKLVKAKHGANGGYSLAKAANKITPGDIVSVLEEDIALVHCAGCPMAGSCSSSNVWEEAKRSLDDTLNSVTLAEMAKQ